MYCNLEIKTIEIFIKLNYSALAKCISISSWFYFFYAAFCFVVSEYSDNSHIDNFSRQTIKLKQRTN